ncbi:hypothetical protein F5148DRAFT_250968 [Russula earlei]|uniref:Uncharacterized protein n=2 Tax=Russula earlei TaxID=71964 RepID=A0ACC0TY12_9AGAM|nr:hypothetical protein F5148DRAFT_493489 [Russula earlei]KAI9461058.1 hypothetical protein F5148DRAFT_250968 [Russula earlei]
MHSSTVFAILCLALGVTPSFAIILPRSGNPSTSRPSGEVQENKHRTKPLPSGATRIAHNPSDRHDGPPPTKGKDPERELMAERQSLPTRKLRLSTLQVTNLSASNNVNHYKTEEFPSPREPSPMNHPAVGSSNPPENVEPERLVEFQKAASEVDVSEKDTLSRQPRPHTAPS